MRTLSLHLKILIALLLLAGVGSIAYQIQVLQVPLHENEMDNLWSIDAKIDFLGKNNEPIKLQMFIPPQEQSFTTLNESFVSHNYGISVNKVDNNRRITWSARRAGGKQTLYYRLAVSSRNQQEDNQSRGPSYRESMQVAGIEKLAAEALLVSIRQNSADIETFVSETIKKINDKSDDNAKLLMRSDYSSERKAQVIDLVLSIAHVPMQQVHTIRLEAGSNQQPELWIRSYNGKKWLYFNPHTGEQGMPSDRLIWWLGSEPLLSLEGGTHPQISFSISKSEINAMRLTQLSSASNGFLDYSLYALPFTSQQSYKIMLMIPVGVLVILILRNIGGLQTLGTFTPVLIALAFRETELLFGMMLFVVITAIGLSLRSYLEHLRLQMLPRLSVVLTFVVILFAVISIFSHKLGLERGLSVSLFPMVILTMTIERLSITWEERGGSHAFVVAIGTLFAATIAYYLMSWQQLGYFIFTFPGTLLIMIAFMLAMGRYRGYRLTELVRFKAFVQD